MDAGLYLLAAIFAASLAGLIALVVVLLRRRSPRHARKVADARSDRESRRALRKGEAAPRRRAISVATLEIEIDEPAVASAGDEGEAPPPARNAAVVAASQQAIVFRRHFPPLLGAGSLSFFGGVPVAQRSFAWPRAADGRPLHFILQVDLAQVAAAGRIGLLPDNGVIYLFLDLEWGEDPAFSVLWQPAATGPLQELAPPSDIAPAYGEAGALLWPWALSAADGTPMLPQWPFEPVTIPVQPADGPAWPDNATVAAALLAAQGEEIWLDPLSQRDFTDMTCPWDGYPQNWLSVQIASAMLVREAERAARRSSTTLWPELDGEARAQRIAQVRDEARAWFDHAVQNPAFGPLNAESRAAFWQWFAGHEALSRLAAPRAFEAAIETSLHAHPEIASRIPVEVLQRIIHRHALVLQSENGPRASTPDRMLAAPSDVQCDQQERAATHLLLFELSSDEAIGHHFGEGVYQFWITPEALAARAFDRVELTTTAY